VDGVLEGVGVVAGGQLHGGRRHHLHHVVDDHVAQRPDRVVEVAAVLDPEALGHGDLHGRHVAPVPQRLQHGVGEAQVQDLVQAHLAQEVVDPVQLRLVDGGVDFVGEGPRRGEVVAEGLLHHHPGAPGQAGVGQALDHPPEQERRDLQVEHRGRGLPDGGADPLEGGRVAEVA
jgi:hypothetical protein